MRDIREPREPDAVKEIALAVLAVVQSTGEALVGTEAAAPVEEALASDRREVHAVAGPVGFGALVDAWAGVVARG